MCKIIIIPAVKNDENIGHAFNFLFRVIDSTEQASEKRVVWDFNNAEYFHPFFIAPLAIYKRKCGKQIEIVNLSDRCKGYFKSLHFDNMIYIDKETNLEQILSEYVTKTYTPLCCFDICGEHVDNLQSFLQRIIERQSHMSIKLKTPLSYFLSELICNIEQHSQSNVGYIYTQFIPSEKCIAICIADEGITIYGSYVNTNKYLEDIGDDEAKALEKANEGFSTKNRPNAETRGYGISTTKRMLVDGLGGDFFMFSGNAFHRHNSKHCEFVNLPPNILWGGTIILMRIPIEVDKNFDYNKFIS